MIIFIRGNASINEYPSERIIESANMLIVSHPKNRNLWLIARSRRTEAPMNPVTYKTLQKHILANL